MTRERPKPWQAVGAWQTYADWLEQDLRIARFDADVPVRELREENARYRAALIECATASGADVSDGPPTWPDVDVWAVQEVKQMREDYDNA